MSPQENFADKIPALDNMHTSNPSVPATFPFGAPMQPFFGAQFQMNPNSPAQQGRNSGARTGVCASRHMAAEQRRRARINGRLEALRTLVPHSARANTAAFLTEVYNYVTSLHKQLERLGCKPLDLNTQSESDKKQTQNLDAFMAKGDAHNPNPRASEFKSDESDVESDDLKQNMDDDDGKTDEDIPHSSLVLAPSLFHPTSKKPAGSEPASSYETTHSNSSEILHSMHSSAFSSVNSDLSLSMKLPISPSSNHSSQSMDGVMNVSTPYASSLALASGSVSAPGPKSRRLREIQPAPLHKSLIQPSAGFPYMPVSSSAVAAAAAAIAESAAFAQTWGMAAAVAQAQAQVAAQVHAQAQAQVQAMTQAQVISQAQTQIHSMNSVTRPCPTLPMACPTMYQPCSTLIQTKKRRRGNTSDICSTRSRRSQNVVRPIALKPQP